MRGYATRAIGRRAQRRLHSAKPPPIRYVVTFPPKTGASIIVLPPILRGRRVYAEKLKRFPRDSDEQENNLPQLTNRESDRPPAVLPPSREDRAAGRAWA